MFVVSEPDFDHVYKTMEAEEHANMDASVVHGGAASRFDALSLHSLQSHAPTRKSIKQSPKDPGIHGLTPV